MEHSESYVEGIEKPSSSSREQEPKQAEAELTPTEKPPMMMEQSAVNVMY